eukprot:Protomagalhaensia_wolfi_Nauph_80__829@NODE_147_length_3434_cov_523_177320_g109_i0_p3_GENE_NODE_147_length_3434_cov_523_177320_g109_i0NODE_147_length_3434_cov_523_177320_g109_i0_p3_ORF_typecomplete_len193_score23_18_NODE_147_length_3434_cov_523_177320_g109_i010661644
MAGADRSAAGLTPTSISSGFSPPPFLTCICRRVVSSNFWKRALLILNVSALILHVLNTGLQIFNFQHQAIQYSNLTVAITTLIQVPYWTTLATLAAGTNAFFRDLLLTPELWLSAFLIANAFNPPIPVIASLLLDLQLLVVLVNFTRLSVYQMGEEPDLLLNSKLLTYKETLHRDSDCWRDSALPYYPVDET